MATTRTERRPTLRRAAALASVVALLLPASGQGGTPEEAAEVRTLLARPLTAEGVARIAELRQPLLGAAAVEVEAARQRRRQAALFPNPEVKLDLRRPGGSRTAQQGDIEVDFDLGHALLIPVRVGIAESEEAAAGHAAQATAVRLVHEARIAFREVQQADRRWRNAVVELEAAVAARDAARALREAGNLSPLDAVRYEAESEARRDRVASLELAYHDAREALQRRLGLYGEETSWQATAIAELPPEEPIDPADVERRVIASSHELARLREALEALERSARLERIEGLLPGLGVDFHAERDETRWEVGGGVRVRVPLFDRRQGATAARVAERRALEHRLRAVAVDLRSRARQLRNRVVLARARARHWQERVIPTQGRVVTETLLESNAMQANVFDVLAARRAELDVERRASDALFEALIAHCALDALLEGAVVAFAATEADDGMPNDRMTGGH